MAIFSPTTQALPNDAWLGLDNHLINKRHPLKLHLKTESALDTVAYEPNLSQGGYANASTQPRYQTLALGIHFRPISPLLLFAEINKQELTSKRDQFKLQAYTLSASYTLPLSTPKKHYNLHLGASSNTSPELVKNSYTHYGNKRIDSLTMHNPYDLQLQANASMTHEINTHSLWSIFTGLGYITTHFSSINGTGHSDDDCQYEFDVGHGQGHLDQIGTCNNIEQFKQQYPNYQEVEKRLGFNPDKDITHKTLYTQLGSGITIRKGHWESSLAYYYQYYDRGEFDKHLRKQGRAFITSSHNLAIRTQYQASNKLSFSLQAQYNQRRAIVQLPVLYTAVTSSNFMKPAIIFSLTLGYAL